MNGHSCSINGYFHQTFLQDGCSRMDAVTCKRFLPQRGFTSGTDGPIRQEAAASKANVQKGHVCSHPQRCNFDILHPGCSVELSRQGSPEKLAHPEESAISRTSLNATAEFYFPRTQHWNSCTLSLSSVGPPCWNYSL